MIAVSVVRCSPRRPVTAAPPVARRRRQTRLPVVASFDPGRLVPPVRQRQAGQILDAGRAERRRTCSNRSRATQDARRRKARLRQRARLRGVDGSSGRRPSGNPGGGGGHLRASMPQRAEDEEEARRRRPRVAMIMITYDHGLRSCTWLVDRQREATWRTFATLIVADPEGRRIYRQCRRLPRANSPASTPRCGQIAAVPAARRRVITSHDAFGYFATTYGIEFVAPRGLSTDAEPSAKAIAALIRQIRR